MKLVYSPTVSTLYNCSSEYVSRLSGFFKHDLDREYLRTFEKLNSLPFTPAYAFKAELQNDDSYKVRIYSGFIKTILLDIYSGNAGVDTKNFNIVSTLHKYEPENLDISLKLYKHQKRIVESVLQNKRGIVKSPTGSGKSFVIAELVRKFTADKLSVLITVPTIDLLHQLTDNIHEYMNINNLCPIEIGKVGDGNYKFANVTIGIPQSLSNIEKTASYLRTVDVLIADEVHTCSTPTYGLMIEYMTHRAVSVGLSATPGDSIFLNAFFGPSIINIEESEMIEKDVIMEPIIKFYKVPHGFLPKGLCKNASNISSLTDGHRYKTLSQVYNWLIVNNDKRNNLILSKSIDRINLELGPVIVIVTKIKGEDSHGEKLRKAFLDRGYNLPIMSGYISKKKRGQLLNDLRSNNIVGCIAGPKVLTNGVSIPSLSTIVLAGAGKSDSEYIQRVGRILRKKEGKERPEVIDFLDEQFWFKTQANSRLDTARNIYGEYNVTII